jgi:small subunit ribosomal protein S6
MRNYQLVLVLRPTLSESERKKVLGSVKDWLKEVKVTKEEEWGQKSLAYKIKRETAGFYVSYELEAEVIPGDLEKRIIGLDSVIRHLVIKTKTKKQEKITKEGEKPVSVKVEKKEEPKKAAEKKEVKTKTVKKTVKQKAKK